MTISLNWLRHVLLGAAVLLLTLVPACSIPGNLASTVTPTSGPTPAATDQPSSAPVPSTQQESVPPTTDQENRIRIIITIGGETFQAHLEDSPATHDLVAQLPLTLTMNDHGSVEKTGNLPSPLSLDGQPPGADPVVGDVGYYAPGSAFVLYYGDQSYYDGIIILGRLEGDAAERIADMDGSITATITSPEN